MIFFRLLQLEREKGNTRMKVRPLKSLKDKNIPTMTIMMMTMMMTMVATNPKPKEPKKCASGSMWRGGTFLQYMGPPRGRVIWNSQLQVLDRYVQRLEDFLPIQMIVLCFTNATTGRSSWSRAQLGSCLMNMGTCVHQAEMLVVERGSCIMPHLPTMLGDIPHTRRCRGVVLSIRS